MQSRRMKKTGRSLEEQLKWGQDQCQEEFMMLGIVVANKQNQVYTVELVVRYHQK